MTALMWLALGIVIGYGLTASYYVRRLRIVVETARASSEKP